VFLFLAAQAFRSLQDWREFFWFAMLFGFFVAGVGILQHLTFNGKLYWLREMRYAEFLSDLTLTAITLPRLPSWQFRFRLSLGSRKVRRERRFVIGLFSLIPIGALLLSASRGGIVSVGVELLFLVSIILLQRAGSKHLLTGGIVLVAALSLVSWIGVKQVFHGSAACRRSKSNRTSALPCVTAHGAFFWIIRFSVRDSAHLKPSIRPTRLFTMERSSITRITITSKRLPKQDCRRIVLRLVYRLASRCRPALSARTEYFFRICFAACRPHRLLWRPGAQSGRLQSPHSRQCHFFPLYGPSRQFYDDFGACRVVARAATSLFSKSLIYKRLQAV